MEDELVIPLDDVLELPVELDDELDVDPPVPFWPTLTPVPQAVPTSVQATKAPPMMAK